MNSHDPLCAKSPTGVHYVGTCTCDLIAKVREDEQLKQYEAQSGNWEDGYFHGIAKCIAAVEAEFAKSNEPPWVGEVTEALRALQEKP